MGKGKSAAKRKKAAREARAAAKDNQTKTIPIEIKASKTSLSDTKSTINVSQDGAESGAPPMISYASMLVHGPPKKLTPYADVAKHNEPEKPKPPLTIKIDVPLPPPPIQKRSVPTYAEIAKSKPQPAKVAEEPKPELIVPIPERTVGAVKTPFTRLFSSLFDSPSNSKTTIDNKLEFTKLNKAAAKPGRVLVLSDCIKTKPRSNQRSTVAPKEKTEPSIERKAKVESQAEKKPPVKKPPVKEPAAKKPPVKERAVREPSKSPVKPAVKEPTASPAKPAVKDSTKVEQEREERDEEASPKPPTTPLPSPVVQQPERSTREVGTIISAARLAYIASTSGSPVLSPGVHRYTIGERRVDGEDRRRTSDSPPHMPRRYYIRNSRGRYNTGQNYYRSYSPRRNYGRDDDNRSPQQDRVRSPMRWNRWRYPRRSTSNWNRDNNNSTQSYHYNVPSFQSYNRRWYAFQNNDQRNGNTPQTTPRYGRYENEQRCPCSESPSPCCGRNRRGYYMHRSPSMHSVGTQYNEQAENVEASENPPCTALQRSDNSRRRTRYNRDTTLARRSGSPPRARTPRGVHENWRASMRQNVSSRTTSALPAQSPSQSGCRAETNDNRKRRSQSNFGDSNGDGPWVTSPRRERCCNEGSNSGLDTPKKRERHRHHSRSISRRRPTENKSQQTLNASEDNASAEDEEVAEHLQDEQSFELCVDVVTHSTPIQDVALPQEVEVFNPEFEARVPPDVHEMFALYGAIYPTPEPVDRAFLQRCLLGNIYPRDDCLGLRAMQRNLAANADAGPTAEEDIDEVPPAIPENAFPDSFAWSSGNAVIEELVEACSHYKEKSWIEFISVPPPETERQSHHGDGPRRKKKVRKKLDRRKKSREKIKQAEKDEYEKVKDLMAAAALNMKKLDGSESTDAKNDEIKPIDKQISYPVWEKFDEACKINDFEDEKIRLGSLPSTSGIIDEELLALENTSDSTTYEPPIINYYAKDKSSWDGSLGHQYECFTPTLWTPTTTDRLQSKRKKTHNWEWSDAIFNEIKQQIDNDVVDDVPAKTIKNAELFWNFEWTIEDLTPKPEENSVVASPDNAIEAIPPNLSVPTPMLTDGFEINSTAESTTNGGASSQPPPEEQQQPNENSHGSSTSISSQYNYQRRQRRSGDNVCQSEECSITSTTSIVGSRSFYQRSYNQREGRVIDLGPNQSPQQQSTTSQQRATHGRTGYQTSYYQQSSSNNVLIGPGGYYARTSNANLNYATDTASFAANSTVNFTAAPNGARTSSTANYAAATTTGTTSESVNFETKNSWTNQETLPSHVSQSSYEARSSHSQTTVEGHGNGVHWYNQPSQTELHANAEPEEEPMSEESGFYPSAESEGNADGYEASEESETNTPEPTTASSSQSSLSTCYYTYSNGYFYYVENNGNCIQYYTDYQSQAQSNGQTVYYNAPRPVINGQVVYNQEQTYSSYRNNSQSLYRSVYGSSIDVNSARGGHFPPGVYLSGGIYPRFYGMRRMPRPFVPPSYRIPIRTSLNANANVFYAQSTHNSWNSTSLNVNARSFVSRSAETASATPGRSHNYNSNASHNVGSSSSSSNVRLSRRRQQIIRTSTSETNIETNAQVSMVSSESGSCATATVDTIANTKVVGADGSEIQVLCRMRITERTEVRSIDVDNKNDEKTSNDSNDDNEKMV